MKRIVCVVDNNGVEYKVPMTAEQAAFILRLAEMKATIDPTITFMDLVVEMYEGEQKSQSDRLN